MTVSTSSKAARGHPEIFEGVRKANARKFRGFEAWEKAIESVKNAVDLPFDEGMAKERALFAGLVVTTQSKAQRYVFFAERQAAKVADIPADTPTRKIAKVGVIGAGTMGGGISMNFLTAGHPRHDRRDVERGARPRGFDHAPQLREHREERPPDDAGGRGSNGPA